jgi:hypothetical protein
MQIFVKYRGWTYCNCYKTAYIPKDSTPWVIFHLINDSSILGEKTPVKKPVRLFKTIKIINYIRTKIQHKWCKFLWSTPVEHTVTVITTVYIPKHSTPWVILHLMIQAF